LPAAKRLHETAIKGTWSPSFLCRGWRRQCQLFGFNEEKNRQRTRAEKLFPSHVDNIEPVFGNITSNKGTNKLTLRGKAKVTCQWMMYCIVHNIEKLWRYGNAGAVSV